MNVQLKEDYFASLRNQITNRENWVKDKFVVFNHEAGSGKSQSTFEILGQLQNDPTMKALYVQNFVKDDRLIKTVEAINKNADGKQIAIGYAKDVNFTLNDAMLMDAQIICITHRMYLQVCRGEHQKLIKGRDILIIDEYIDLVEEISVSVDDIGSLWMRIDDRDGKEIVKITESFRILLSEVRRKSSEKLMQYLDFNETKYKKYPSIIKEYMNKISNETEKEFLADIIQIIKNGCLFYNDAMHTYDKKNKFKLLKNNIILDANGGFDFRYAMSDMFIVREQGKIFDFSMTNFFHFQTNTSRHALSKQIDLQETILSNIPFQDKKGVLIVTDKGNKDHWEKAINDHLHELGEDVLHQVDYFGNLIGVNTYREYDTVIIAKTPYYDYLAYAINFFYYTACDNKKMGDIHTSIHLGLKCIRSSIVAGEVYQAIRRINRQCKLPSEIHLWMDFPEATDIILQQLPNLQRMTTRDYDDGKQGIQQKNNDKKGIFAERIEQIKEMLLQYQREGKQIVSKQELREAIGVKDCSNFTEYIRSLKEFFEKNNMYLKGTRKIVINTVGV